MPARDDVLAAGMTINGLPIMLKKPSLYSLDIENLDVYYEDCVIGGPGSFVIAIRERNQFKQATREKLVQEVAGRSLRRASSPPSPRRASPAPSASRCGASAGEIGESRALIPGFRCAQPGLDLLFQPRHQLHMRRIEELVDRRDSRQPVAAVDQNSARRVRKSRRCTRPRPPSAPCSARARAPARLRPAAADRTPQHRCA